MPAAFDRKIEHYRAKKVNEAVKLTDSFSIELGDKKNERSTWFIDLSL
ncbi:hypothetical protein [Ohtaekwangia koreensis]|uniref:Uncharacterized protein n=1 Tax=Ohtaekwangia koreensis TaxID=688867 RepID=A0A1T5J6W5_9BACT|nr:hypothetical protein [Ohtaekwangia koreensis]SKC46973.1 hypothetical protein SAMN05660236_0811 [Ohtaekwangia koreensis]